MSRNITPRWKDGWRIVGPGGGGAQFAPTISPHDDRDMFICCDMSGFYRSQDAGESFLQMNFGIIVTEIVYHPCERDVVFGCATGLYKSTDAGRSWKLIMPKREDVVEEVYKIHHDEAVHQYTAKGWPGGWCDKLVIERDNPDIMLLGVTRTDFTDTDDTGVFFFVTRDGGDSWNEVLQGSSGKIIRTVFIDKGIVQIVTDQGLFIYDIATGAKKDIGLPPDSFDIWSANAGRLKDGSIIVYCVGRFVTPEDKDGTVILYAYENGQWRKCDVGFIPPRQGVTNGRFVASCENLAETVYYSIYRTGTYADSGQLEGLMRSDDAGRTWGWALPITDEFPDNFEKHWLDSAYGSYWAAPPIGVGVSPQNPDVVTYTTFGTSHRSDDGGKSWRALCGAIDQNGASVTRGLDVTTCYGYHTNPFNIKERIISYTDIGMLRSEDGGNGWLSNIKGVPHEWTNTAYWTIYDPKIENKVYSCWASHHDLPLRKMFFYQNWYADWNKGGVCISDDGGRSWRPTLHDISTSDILLDPDSPKDARVLYAAVCGTGVYKSVDGGETWELKNNGLPENNYAYKFARTGDGTIYLVTVRAMEYETRATIPGRLYVSTDGAETWQERKMPDGETGMGDLVADIHRDGGIYICCRPGWNKGEGEGGLHYSSDGCKSWTRLPLEVAGGYTHNISQDPARPGRLFVTTFVNALYRSDDYGQTWHRLGGFNFRAAHRPSVDPEDPDMIFVPCFGSSVWHGPALGNGKSFEDIIG